MLEPQRRRIQTIYLEGIFKISQSIVLDSYTRLDLSAAQIHTVPNLAGPAITNRSTEHGNHHIEITGGIIVGTGIDETNPLLNHGVSLTRVSNLKLRNINISGFNGTGILVTGRGRLTRFVDITDIYVHGNRWFGANITWAMRNVRVTNLTASENGEAGLRSDHSEGIYANIILRNNPGHGLIIRNVFGNSYSNITSTNNGKTGVYIVGMTHSVGASWGIHNNSARQANQWSDIFFAADGSLSYGVTSNTVINGVAAGPVRFHGATTEKYAIEFETELDPSAIFHNLNLSNLALTPGIQGGPIFPPTRLRLK